MTIRGQMKSGGWNKIEGDDTLEGKRVLILGTGNIGRGFIVNTDEVTNALQNGWLGGAVLDVTEPEPLPEKHPLRYMEMWY